MKKLINGVDNVVDEMLNGMTAAFPEYIERVPGTDVVARTGAKKTDKVVLISGGGSGHAAVAGAVFTAPTPDQVYEAIQATECGKGALLIIKNYTGDVMNFEMAADMAADEDIVVDKVVVADDVAVENSTWTTGRRGIAGTVFVHKIAGACAETGADLPEVKRIAEKVIANVRSMGMAVSPCTVPAVGKPGFDLAEDEVEIGIGIHGEPGTHREKISAVNNTVDHLVGKILDEGIYAEGDEVAVMVNGMGATPLSELFIANLRVKEILDEKKISIAKTLVGNYMTSLDMAGFSVTLLKLDDELKGFLNDPADTPAYKEV